MSGTSRVPQLTSLSADRVLLSWQKPLPDGGYAFQMAIRDHDQWSAIRTIASGAKLSFFSADLPAVATLPDGKLLAYWELTDPRDGDPYATTIQTSLSADEGKTWDPPSRPYGEALAGQHSFLSWFPASQGAGLLWLDANEQAKVRHAAMEHDGNNPRPEMGSIGLRYAALNSQGEVVKESFIEPITCECCPTSAAVSGKGPVVVFRGRQEAPGTTPAQVRPDRPTVRDIYITRLASERWTTPHRVHADNWVINACPDNGPSVDAKDNDVVVAWWTAAGGGPKVQVAFSSDAGDSFREPIRVDGGQGSGQVTVVLVPGGKAAIVGWLEDDRTWARYVTADGRRSAPVALGSSPHHSRLPRWIMSDEHNLTAAWTRDDGEDKSVAISKLRF